MTIGRGSVRDSAWSAQSACSKSSARSLRMSTVARRTVHTLIGSYDALSTRTRPDEVPRCSVRRPGSARTGAGSPASMVTVRALSATVRASVARARPLLDGRIGAQHPDRLHPLAQGGERLVHVRLPDGALEIGEEHVVPEPDPPRPRLDLREVDVAVGELSQDGDERPRPLVVEAPEDDRGLRARPRVYRLVGRRQPDEAGLVVGMVLDVRREDAAAVELGG